MSRNLRLLGERGWLDVIREESGRTNTLELTAKGREVFRKAMPLWENAQHKAESILGKNGIKEVMRIAESVRSSCEEQ